MYPPVPFWVQFPTMLSVSFLTNVTVGPTGVATTRHKERKRRRRDDVVTTMNRSSPFLPSFCSPSFLVSCDAMRLLELPNFLVSFILFNLQEKPVRCGCFFIACLPILKYHHLEVPGICPSLITVSISLK